MAVMRVNFGNCCCLRWGVTEWLLSGNRHHQMCIYKDYTEFCENKIVRAKLENKKSS